MDGQSGPSEPCTHRGRIKVPYTWWVGETGGRFFTALRDEQKILGTRCTTCRITFVLPRKACGKCFNTAMEWREVGRQVTVASYTAPRYREPIHPEEKPFAFALVRLDGADNTFNHFLEEADPAKIRVGRGVEAVFERERRRHPLDIRDFRTLEE